MPANAALVYGFVMKIASFDLLPTDTFYDTYFRFSEKDSGPVNSNFESLGYESLYFLRNMGTLTLSLLSIPFLIAVQLIFK